MKTAVIYESRYGYTKKYAQWLSQALSCDLFDRKTVRTEQLKLYDVIIYGGGLYAGGVSGIRLFTGNFDLISDKTLILFTCGLADPSDPQNAEHIRAGLSKVLSPRMQEKIKLFHLRGGMDYSKLNMAHKSMMAMLFHLTKRKDPVKLRAEDLEMLQTYGKTVDFTDPAAIQPIVDFVAGL